MDLTAWLASISWPIVSRILAALGMGTVTYTGLTTAVDSYFTMAKASLAGLGGTVMQILAMAGVFDFLSITSGGIISGMTWMVLKRFALQTTGTT